jgi:hypothetical protein
MSYQGISTEKSNIDFHTTFIPYSSFPYHLYLVKIFYFNNNTMRDVDVICRRNAVGILTVMKNIAIEYIENVYNSASHSTLYISGKVWDQSIVITTTIVRLTKRNISVKSITTIVIQIKHNLLQRQQTGCVTKHKYLE